MLTDQELDDLTAKLARQITIKMCRQAADAIIELRARAAALKQELAAANAAIKIAQDEAAWLLTQRDADAKTIALKRGV